MKIHLQREAQPIFLQMAKEAGISTADLAEIACYNLIALWVKKKGAEGGLPETADLGIGAVPHPAPESHGPRP